MLNNIDDFRRNANILIGITMSALIFIALVEPFLFWANISKLTYCLFTVNLFYIPNLLAKIGGLS